jgi:quercetin dioxygenase-like cupin family protein
LTDTRRPFVVGPGDGETLQGPVGGPITFKARAEQTNGALTVFENVVAPGDGPPVHVHAGEDECWYLLEGELQFKLGEDLHDVAAGAFVYVPRGVPHAFRNIGDGYARMLVAFTPSGMERFFDRFAAPARGVDAAEAFVRIGRDVGMEVVGPPLS